MNAPIHILSSVTQVLYRVSAVGGAIGILGICVLILSQILSRQLGIYLPESDELTAWMMAGSVFLPLGWIYRAGGHIRVELTARKIEAALGERQTFLILLAVGLLLSLVALWASIDLVIDSLRFDERSTGTIGMPYALPQSFMAVGFFVLATAIVEDIVRVLSHHHPAWRKSGTTADILERAGAEL